MCIGPFKRICHWGPLIAMGIIKAVTFATVWCLSQWWPPQQSWGGTIMFFSFTSSASLTLFYFMQAMFTGPGMLPKKWIPVNEADKKFLQYCATCEGYKAPRAHHCRKCNGCVMKMDHHCPWINNCVGHRNHGTFTMFLAWAVIGCAQATFILSVSIYRAIHRMWYIYYGTGNEPLIYLSLWGMVSCMFILGLAIGVVLAVGMLFYFQMRSILRNRTGIEDWILEKAIHRRDLSNSTFVYPYNLGYWHNLTQVLNLMCMPICDGITWPIREECNQYTLTIEQLEQKADKRARSREYQIIENASGWWFPCTKGFGVCCHPPCTDETRISLDVGDVITVTRWKRYWLYGERIDRHSKKYSHSDDSSSSSLCKRHRGWFPRRCAVEVYSREMNLAREVDEDEEHREIKQKPQEIKNSNKQETKKRR